MADSPPRSPRPWIALIAAVAAVGAVLFVLRLLGSDRDEIPRETLGEASPPVSEPAMDLRPLTPTERQPAQPLPGLTEGLLPPPTAFDLDAGALVVVYGHVVDERQRPLPDVDVTLYDDAGDFIDLTTTGEQGEFIFEWDEPLAAGWSVATDPDPAADAEDPNSTAPAIHVHGSALSPGDPAVRVELVVGRAPRITGLVLDDLTGEPIDLANVEVVVMLQAFLEEYQDDFTDEDGRFAFSLVDVPARGILVRVTDDEGRAAMYGPFDMLPGQMRHLEFRLRDEITLYGTVYAADTGLPLEDVEVYLLPLHPMFDVSDAWDMTDEEGGFEFEASGAPADMLLVYALAPEHGPAVVRVTDPSRPVDIRLGEVLTLTGRVVWTGTEEPVADAELRFVLRGPWGLVEEFEDLAFGDDEGLFEATLESVPPEAAELFIDAPGAIRRRVYLSELLPTGRHWDEAELILEIQPVSKN